MHCTRSLSASTPARVSRCTSARIAARRAVPVRVWERLLEAAEDELDAELARDRLTRDNGRLLSRAEVDQVFDQLRAGRSA